MSYVYLAIAIASELTATMTLRATHSFTRFWPSLVVIVAVCSSLYTFSLCLRTLNVAIVYAVWSGIGIAAITLLGWIVYGQKLDPPALLGIGLILLGVIIINLFSQTVDTPDAASPANTVESNSRATR